MFSGLFSKLEIFIALWAVEVINVMKPAETQKPFFRRDVSAVLRTLYTFSTGKRSLCPSVQGDSNIDTST